MYFKVTSYSALKRLYDYLDERFIPKFKRADWYSGKVAFKIEDFDTLEQFVGIFEPGEVKDFPETYNGKTIYLTVKESNISFHKELPQGMPCVTYHSGYTFPSALEVM